MHDGVVMVSAEIAHPMSFTQLEVNLVAQMLIGFEDYALLDLEQYFYVCLER